VKRYDVGAGSAGIVLVDGSAVQPVILYFSYVYFDDDVARGYVFNHQNHTALGLNTKPPAGVVVLRLFGSSEGSGFIFLVIFGFIFIFFLRGVSSRDTRAGGRSGIRRTIGR